LDGLSISYSGDHFDYRVALDYDLNKDIMVYGQIATGFKGGGNATQLLFPSQLHSFESEELTNYEVGVKSTLFDQLRLNASVFFNDYADIQLNVDLCTWAPESEQFPCIAQDNVGDAEVTGFELEGVWRPTEAFSVDFSYAYIDFQYTELSSNTGIDIDSNTPYTPNSTWSLGAQYRLGLGDGWGTLTPRIDVSFQDDMETGGPPPPNTY
jgi:iron complex outermembrane receptor protein